MDEAKKSKKRKFKIKNGEDFVKCSNANFEVENIFPNLSNILVENCMKFDNEIQEVKKGQNGELYEMGGKKLGRIKEELSSFENFLLNICQELKEK